MDTKSQNTSRPSRATKPTLHPKNKHKGRYNFDELNASHPDLETFVKPNKYGDLSIDFSNPKAVRALNTALLKHFYDISYWEIPENYLCPPIPGRADYIHHIAQLLGKKNKYKVPMNGKVKCLDVGTGANCIYPIIGHQEYGWHFVGSDIDETAIKSAIHIVEKNKNISENIELRLQSNSKHIFKGIIRHNEVFDLIICNPPFHSSEKDAMASAQRKVKNLKQQKLTSLNFGGTHKELWCKGGEKQFIANMIKESLYFKKSCYWFTTLVSKKENLKAIYSHLKRVDAHQIKTINMGQGNKISRIVAWTFLTDEEQEEWMHKRWRKWTTEKN